jgi:hypothetical protein
MPFAAILIGAILVVVAFNGTHADLGKALMADVPGFFKWGLAIAIILGLGYIPGLRTPSRWLLALVAVVLLLTRGGDILAGFTSFTSSSGQPTAVPAAATSGSGTSSASTAVASAAGTVAQVANPIAMASAALANPAHYVSSFVSSIGFGGLA